MDTPIDIWTIIAGFCTHASRLTLRSVCRRFRDRIVIREKDSKGKVLLDKSKVGYEGCSGNKSTKLAELLNSLSYPQGNLMFKALRSKNMKLLFLSLKWFGSYFDDMLSRKSGSFCCTVRALSKADCGVRNRIYANLASIGRIDLLKRAFKGKDCCACQRHHGPEGKRGKCRGSGCHPCGKDCFGGRFMEIVSIAALYGRSNTVVWISRKCGVRPHGIIYFGVVGGKVTMVEGLISLDYPIDRDAVDLAFGLGDDKIKQSIIGALPKDSEEAIKSGFLKYANWLETGEYGFLEWQPPLRNGLLEIVDSDISESTKEELLGGAERVE